MRMHRLLRVGLFCLNVTPPRDFCPCAGLRTRPRPQVALGGWLWGGGGDKPEKNDIFQVGCIFLCFHFRNCCFWWTRDGGFRNAQGRILPCCFGRSRSVDLREYPCRAPAVNASCPLLTICKRLRCTSSSLTQPFGGLGDSDIHSNPQIDLRSWQGSWFLVLNAF